MQTIEVLSREADRYASETQTALRSAAGLLAVAAAVLAVVARQSQGLFTPLNLFENLAPGHLHQTRLADGEQDGFAEHTEAQGTGNLGFLRKGSIRGSEES